MRKLETFEYLFIAATAVIIAIGVFALTAAFSVHNVALASAPSGLPATVATSSALSASSRTAQLLFATSTSCSARVITTTGVTMMLTFGDNQGKRPTGTYGHLQAASTTIAYDSGLYGCGAVYGYSDAAQNLSLTETR